VKRVLLFLLKFAVVAPVCLLVGWEAAPYYAWVIGQGAGMLLVVVFGVSIEAMRVTEEGILNSKSLLVFVVDGQERSLPIVPLVTNLPAYVALVLATVGLVWRRRLVALGIGCGVLAVTHVAYVVLVFVYSDVLQKAPQIPEMLITLPFLLWIVLIYGRELTAYFVEGDVKNTPGK